MSTISQAEHTFVLLDVRSTQTEEGLPIFACMRDELGDLFPNMIIVIDGSKYEVGRCYFCMVTYDEWYSNMMSFLEGQLGVTRQAVESRLKAAQPLKRYGRFEVDEENRSLTPDCPQFDALLYVELHKV